MQTTYSMRKLLSSSLFLFSILLSGQSNTEIFLFNTDYDSGELQLINGKNISNNEGYDNQPSFINDNAILFSSTRNGQTDILEYRANYGSKTWLCFTEGGEYTPLKIPNSNKVSAVRLDKDGKQRLYAYDLRNAENSELIKDLVVAYYTWFNDNIIVSAVIEDNGLNLFATNLKEGTSRKYQTNVGRSFHKIPNSKLVSYISKVDDANWQIKSLDPLTGATKFIANTLPGVEDICWLINGTILSAKDNRLFVLDTKKNSEWKEIMDLKSMGINKITRISSNAISSKLLIAADIGKAASDSEDNDTNTPSTNDPEMDSGAIVQKHIGPFNNRDLDGFVNAFSENVIVSSYPNKILYEGRDKMRANYERFYENNDAVVVNTNNRMVIKDMVIDEEIVSIGKTMKRQATIYKTGNANIQSMTFVANIDTATNPEIIVNKQLEAYNDRNIEAFMATYTDDIKLYNYPNELTTEGQAAMRKSYLSRFEHTKDLKAVIKKRIVVGNKVIDQEQVTANGQIFNAIAIYEVENGLISKVTFIQ